MRNTIFVLLILASGLSHAEQKLEGSIGVCLSVLGGDLYKQVPNAAFYDLSPSGFAGDLAVKKGFFPSLREFSKLYGTEKVTVLDAPQHGSYVVSNDGPKYYPDPTYSGEDKLSLLVEIGGYKLNVVYFIHVGGGGTDEQHENDTCPDPRQKWIISSTEISINNENT